MKFVCSVDNLRSRVSIINRATGKNLSLPVLSNIVFNANNEKLTLKATNLEIGVEMNIPVKIESNGSFGINGAILSGYLNALSPESKLNIEKVQNSISFTCSGNSTIFNIEPHEDFPIIPKTSLNKTVIKTKTLIEGIKSVLFSSATSDIKQEIASVYIYKENNNLVFVATDSFRLAEKKIKANDTNLESLLIPFRNAAEIIKFFEDSEERIELSYDKNQLSLTTKDTHFTTRLTEGVYPNYQQILPSKFKTKIVVLREELFSALKISNLFLDEFSRLTMRVITEDDTMEVLAKNNKIGENVARIKIHAEGDGVEVSFNHRYVGDVFSIIQTDSVQLSFSDANKPLVISPVGDTTFSYLVMPVHR